jgi:hypothetical protein
MNGNYDKLKTLLRELFQLDRSGRRVRSLRCDK